MNVRDVAITLAKGRRLWAASMLAGLAVAACGASGAAESNGRSEGAATTACKADDWTSIGVSSCAFDGISKLTCVPIDTTKVAVAWYADVIAVNSKQETVALRFEQVGLTPTTADFRLTTTNVDVSQVCCNAGCQFVIAKVAPCSFSPSDPRCIILAGCTSDWSPAGYSVCHVDSASQLSCPRRSPYDVMPGDLNLVGLDTRTQEAVGRSVHWTDASDSVAHYQGDLTGICNQPIDDQSCYIRVCNVALCTVDDPSGVSDPYASCGVYAKPPMPRPVCCETTPFCCYQPRS